MRRELPKTGAKARGKGGGGVTASGAGRALGGLLGGRAPKPGGTHIIMATCGHCGRETDGWTARIAGALACEGCYRRRSIGMLAKSDMRRRHMGGAYRGGYLTDCD